MRLFGSGAIPFCIVQDLTTNPKDCSIIEQSWSRSVVLIMICFVRLQAKSGPSEVLDGDFMTRCFPVCNIEDNLQGGYKEELRPRLTLD